MTDQRRGPVATDLPVAALAEHPKNDKLMTPAEKKKLRAHIEANGGQFPRLIVRELDSDSEYWSEDGPEYQILDGHQRKALLIEMGYETVPVDIWSGISDERALVLIATLDRLHARSIPVKRAELLNQIETFMPPEDLDRYLVEDEEERNRFHQIMEVENREVDDETREAMEKAAKPPEPPKEEWVTREFIIPAAAAIIVDEAIKDIRGQLSGKNRSGQALEYLAATYLAGSRRVDAETVESLKKAMHQDEKEPGDAAPEETEQAH